MKIYLGGPRVGKTELLSGVQFINGVAEIPAKHPILEKYYACVYTDPRPKAEKTNGLQEETKEEVIISTNTQIENDGTQNEDAALLAQLVEQKKQELEAKSNQTKPLTKEEIMTKFDEFKTWGEKRSFVREVTGTLPRNKEQAMEFLQNI